MLIAVLLCQGKQRSSAEGQQRSSVIILKVLHSVMYLDIFSVGCLYLLLFMEHGNLLIS